MNKRSFFLITNIFLWIFIFVKILLSTASYTVVKTPFSEKKILFKIVPEGWGFFTKDPREDMAYFFKKENNKLTLINYPNSSYKNLFGLSRNVRRMTGEFLFVKQHIPFTNWINVSENTGYKALYKPNLKAVLIKNKLANPVFLGEYIIVLQEPVPFAWNASLQQEEMPYKYCYVKVY